MKEQSDAKLKLSSSITWTIFHNVVSNFWEVVLLYDAYRNIVYKTLIMATQSKNTQIKY
jgi:hypothetical protein